MHMSLSTNFYFKTSYNTILFMAYEHRYCTYQSMESYYFHTIKIATHVMNLNKLFRYKDQLKFME